MHDFLRSDDEKEYPNKHLREKGGYSARKKRGEDIKEEMENERVIQSLKREQCERSEGYDGMFFFPVFY